MTTSIIVRTLRKKLSTYVDPPGSFNSCALYNFDTANIYVDLEKPGNPSLECGEDGNNIEIVDKKQHPLGKVYEILTTELNDLYLRNEIFGATALWPFAISLANKDIELSYKSGKQFLSSVYLFQNDISLIRNSATTLYGKTLQTTGGTDVTPYQGIILQDLRSGDLDSVRQLAAISPTNYTIFRRFIEIMRNGTDVDTQYNALRQIACLKRNGLGIYSYQTISGYYTTPEYTSTNTPAQNTGSVQLAYQPFNSSTYTYSLEWTTINALRNINRLSEIDYSTGMFKFDGNIYNLVYMIRVGNKMIPYIPIWYDGFDVETYLAHNFELPDELTADKYKTFMTEETVRTLNATKAIKFVCEFATGSGNYPRGQQVTTTIGSESYTLYRLESWCAEEIRQFVQVVNKMSKIEQEITDYVQTRLTKIKQLFPQRQGESYNNWIRRITGHRLNPDGTPVIMNPTEPNSIENKAKQLYNADNGKIYNGNIAEEQVITRHSYWAGIKTSNDYYYDMITETSTEDYATFLYKWRWLSFGKLWYVINASSEQAYLINVKIDDFSYELDNNDDPNSDSLALNFDQVYLYYDGLKEIFGAKIICLPMVQVKRVIDACYQTSSNMNKKVLCFLRDDIAYLKRVYNEWFGSNKVLNGETCIERDPETNAVFNKNAATYFRKWQTILAINFAYADYTAGKSSSATKVTEDELYQLYTKCQPIPGDDEISGVNYRHISDYYLFYLDYSDYEWHTGTDNTGYAVKLYLKPIGSTYPTKNETKEIGLTDEYTVNSDGTITLKTDETTYEKLIVFANETSTIPMFDMIWKDSNGEQTTVPPAVREFNASDPNELTAEIWANEMYYLTKDMLDYVKNGFLEEISQYCARTDLDWDCRGYETFRGSQINQYLSCCNYFAQNITDVLRYYDTYKEKFEEIIPRVKGESDDLYETRVTLDYNRLKKDGKRIDEIIHEACIGIHSEGTFYPNITDAKDRTALWKSITDALEVFRTTAVLNDPRTPTGLISDIREYKPKEGVTSYVLYDEDPFKIVICEIWASDPYDYSGYISPEKTYRIESN